MTRPGTAGPVEVIIPNLKRRYSGVTAANRSLAPLIAKACSLVWLGPSRPADVVPLSFIELLKMRFCRGGVGSAVIWSARRNTEMLAGLILKWLGWRLRLVFVSAGQRKKSKYTNYLINNMDAVVATSAASAAYVNRLSTVIHHGVDTNLYTPPKDRKSAFAAVGLPGRFGIGIFGRVRKQKGVDIFVEAMLRLLPHYPDFTAVIIGFVSPDNRRFVEELKERSRKAGLSDRILFLGELPIEEVPTWYQRISVYVFASRVEGFGLTILEAMASGVAVVATRAGAAETVIADGDTGLLVPVDDADALTAAVESLMRDPERAYAMGLRGRDRVVKEFSNQREADDIVAFYRHVLTQER